MRVVEPRFEGSLLKALGCVEDAGKQVDVADRVEEDARPSEHPPNSKVDIRLRLERLVPGASSSLAPEPRPQGDGFDRLDGNVALSAGLRQRLEALGVIGQLHGHKVVREQH